MSGNTLSSAVEIRIYELTGLRIEFYKPLSQILICVNIKPVTVLPFAKSKNGITVKIRVEPRSSRKGISGVMGDTIKIKLHSPPVGGAANEELIEVLSEEFDIKKSAIKIIRGHTSKEKVVEIQGKDSLTGIK